MANEKLDIESIYYLSPLQEGLLFHAVSDAERDPYFTQSCYAIDGNLNVEAFERAWQDTARRHAILRTVFVWEEVKRPVQVVRRSARLALEALDLRPRGQAEIRAALSDWLERDRARGFGLAKAPLMRLALLRTGEASWIFVNSHHHLLLDGWSFALLLREVLGRYGELRAAAPRPTAAAARPGPTYRDYVNWVQTRDAASAERFWLGALEGFVGPTALPFDASVEGVLDARAAFPYAEQVETLSRAETAELAAFARQLRVTPNTLVQGAWALLLQRHAGVSDVVFGATVAGRPPELAGSEDIVGLLINTLPVRVQANAGDTLGPWLARIQSAASQSRDYEWTPLSTIARSRPGGARTLFESIVVFDSYPEDESGELPDGLRIAPLPGAAERRGDVLLVTGRNNYPLSLMVEPNQELGFVFCYDRARFSDAAIRCLRRQLRTVLAEMQANPGAELSELALLDAAERDRILASAVHGPARSASDTPTADTLFRAQVQAAPERLALICGDARLTYRELGAQVNAIAAELEALGVQSEDRVALCMERSPELIAAIFGVLEAGGAYVPLDPKFPSERSRDMVRDSGARVVLCQGAFAAAFEGLGVPVLDIERVRSTAPVLERPRRGSQVRPAQLAYLIYTSGSTGRPKGVGVEHRQLVNYVSAVLERLQLTPDATLGYVSTVAADLGHTSLFGALLSGRTLHVLSNELAFSPDGMADVLAEQPLDALKIVPSHLQALLHAANPEHVLPRRCLVLGGETASRALLEQVRALAPECRVVNHYGPTETTVGALTWELERASLLPPRMPIGRALGGLAAYVLDASFAPAAVGIPGELYIGGAGVARGYHERPSLTAERFVPDPFGGAGQRLYRTGDRARLRPDGTIEFLGRADHQIKLRGHRIELGEIEVQLRALEGVRDAVVVVQDRARPGQEETRRLVAYVVPRPGATLDAVALTAELARRLPDYMVPSAIVPLHGLPLTENGKIDRAALPDPDAAPVAGRRELVEPRTATERLLAELWADVLGLPEVSIADDFFALGGDSILSLQIIARANQRGLRITPKQLFAHPTIQALAASLEPSVSAVASAAPASPAAADPERVALPEPFALSRLEPALLAGLRERHGSELEDVYPATAVQHGMLLHGLLRPEDGPYLNQVVCRFTAGLDVEAFSRAWRQLAAAHPVLRTSFLVDGVPEPHQLVWRSAELPIEQLDLRALAPDARSAAVDEQLRVERVRGLRFEERPLMRLTVLRTGAASYDVIWTVHHAILDGWCQARLIRDWMALYAGQPPAAPLDAAPPYRLYMGWLERRDRAGAEQFFRRYLTGYSTPLRLPKPARAVTAAGCRERRVQLPAALSQALEQHARASGVTLNTVIQAAWALTLSRYGAGGDVLFGVTVSGRPAELPGSDAVLGVFINSLPLRLRLSPAAGARAWLRQIQDVNLELREHEATPLADVQRWSEPGPGTPLFDTLLVFQNYPLDAALESHAGSLGLEVRAEEAWTHYPLTLFVMPGDELTILFSQDMAALEDDTLERLIQLMTRSLERIAALPDATLAEWLAPSVAEVQELATWNATGRVFPPEQSVLAVLAARARRHPERVAVASGGRTLSYAALEARSNQLARQLMEAGAGRESWVGLALSRSVELLVAVLAVLKAGAAYVPLDPSYPKERVRYMLEDARVALLLTEAALLEQLPPHAGRTVCIDRDASEIERRSSAPVEVTHPDEALAYAIYTSGSTGRPKGVMVRRGALDNFTNAMLERLAPPEGTVLLASTSLSFDIAVLELLLPLYVGGRVVIAEDEGKRDAEQLLDLLLSSGATWMQATPSAWKMLLELERSLPAGLTVLCGGEALPLELARDLMQTGATVWNLYGPTETTVWSSAAKLGAPLGDVLLGEPIANTTLYVLDAWLQPVPVGVAGELYIGGAGLARGYARRPALTAERFVPDALGKEPGARLYRTGDLVRLLPGGRLQFLGRLDHQLKIRGYRIELGEVEAQLRACPGVADAAAVARHDTGEPALVAYVIPAPGVALDAARLRSELAAVLPEHMLPSALVALERWPLTPNGKLDRRALPAPGRGERARAVPPRTPTEARLAELWSEVLGLEDVGVFDNFFELGGHSLIATRLMSRVRTRCAVEVPLRALFEGPTIAELAARIDAARTEAVDALAAPSATSDVPPIVPAPRDGALPLSFAQQRLWFLEQLPGAAGRMTIPFALRLTGALDVRALQQALSAVMRRHDVLRTLYVSEAGAPRQVILAESTCELVHTDLRAVDEASRAAAVERALEESASATFDLSREPPLRAQLLRLGTEQHVVILTLHHIAVDAWSIALLVDDLTRAYAASAANGGARVELERPALQYADFAVWQRRALSGPRSDEQLAYWRRELAGSVTSLRLPGAAPNVAPSSRAGRVERSLPAAAARGLEALATAQACTPFMLLWTALDVLLYQQTSEPDLLIGTDVAGRGSEQTEGMVGFFVNQLVLRSRIEPARSLGDLLAQCKRTALAAYQHQDLPFDALVAELLPQRNLESPFFQVKLLFDGVPRRELSLPGLAIDELPLRPAGADVDLLINVSASEDGLAFVFDYREGTYTASFVEGLAELYLAAVARMPDALERSVAALVAELAELERARLARSSTRGTEARGAAIPAGKRRAVARADAAPLTKGTASND